jgi:hypothetical protein
MFEIIENEKFLMRINNLFKYMEYIIKEGVTVDVADVIASKKTVVEKNPGAKFYVLAEGVEFFTLTKKAREHCSTKEHLDNTYAVAFYTKNASILLLGELFNKINKPPVPVKIFTNRESAKDWLREQAYKNGDSAKF